MVVLAHAEAAAAHGGAAQLLRLGPLLALLLVVAWAWLERAGSATRTSRGWLGSAAAVALGTAGGIHLALVGQHAQDSTASGGFFAAAGIVELLLAAALWRAPGSRRTALAAGVTVVGLLVVYAMSRLWSIPAFGGREAVDTLGLLTKLLEVTGAALAAGWTARPIPPSLLVAGTTVAVALAARVLFDLGPEPWTVVVVILVTVAIGLAVGSRKAEELGVAAADGALLALLLRAGGPVPYLLAGVAAGLLRVAAGRSARWPLAPVATAALGALAVPALDARLEVLHVSHAGDPTAWLAAFLAAMALAVGVWRSGRLPVVAGFFLAHLGLQGLRLLAGRTSLEAVEIPATSLGLFLLATVVLADPRLAPAGIVPGALVGGLAGGIDVALRALGTPYAPLLAITIALAVTAPFRPVTSETTRQEAAQALAASTPRRDPGGQAEGRPWGQRPP
jgi:hypothetical protein